MIPMPPRGVIVALAVMAIAAITVWTYSRTYAIGYAAGELHERNATREAADARQREDQRLASQLAASARAEAASARDTAHRLQMELAHGRTALVRPGTCVPGGVAHAAAMPDAGVPAAGGAPADHGQPAGAGLPPGLPADSGPGLALTAGAVRLWNSALAGRPVAAGACGAADAPAGACDADAGITLDEAWANHIENASRCSVDRINHRRLIEFIRRQSAGDAAGAPAQAISGQTTR